MSTTPVLASSYDYRLVALSFVIAMFTSYTALRLAARVTANHGFLRVAWLMGGASAMGIGIWCMHFIGMLAFRLPTPVYYHVPTVMASLVAAIAASSIALYVVSRPRLGLAHLVVGSLLMGSGIAAMHYIGMAAMRLAALHFYNAGLLVLSIVLAVAISLAGLVIIYYSGGEKLPWQRTLGAAFALGIAIPMMHYTGMAAVHFVASPVLPDLTHAVDISTLAYAGILSTTLVVLGFALFIAVADRRWSAQQLLLESERQMLRAFIDNIPDLMYVKDTESRFVLANPQIARAVGAHSPEELIGRTEFDFLPSERVNGWYEQEKQIIATGEPIFNHETVMADSHGKQIPFLISTVPIRDSEGQIAGIAGVRRNISERKKSEEALAAAEGKYRAMFDQALFGIFQLGSEGHLLNLNTAMAQLLLYATPKEMLDCFRDPLWTAAVLPQRISDLLAGMAAFGHVRGFEFEIYCKDRSRIWISATVRSLGKESEAAGFEGMFEDITERRWLREQLQQAQKLESVGQLAAGIAHEINTPTQYIGDNVRFLKKTFVKLETLLAIYGRLWEHTCGNTVTPGLVKETESALQKTNVKFLLEEIPKAINDGLEGIQRVSALVSAMKEFSHPGTKEKIPLDLNHAIQSTITVAQNEWKYVAEVETDLEPTLPRVNCLPGEFNQVILNLIVNAAHAIADRERNGTKGRIRVQTTQYPSGVEIRIGDTGTGIPPEVRSKIFDPFFTTKEIGKGTGQGLAIARSVIVDKHGGSIEFDTVMGEGTTFIIRLPADPQAAESVLVAP